MKVIAEFVDLRNGNRYYPGEGWKIDPALAPEQVERLRAVGALRDGEDRNPNAVDQAQESKGAAPSGGEIPDVDKMSKVQLEELAAKHNVDLTDCANNAQRAEKLKAAGVGA